MNSRTSFALLAILTAVGTLTMTSAYAAEANKLPQACVGCSMEDARETAKMMLLQGIPVSVWTDKTEYNHNEMIEVKGKVANIASGSPVTLTVVSPLNSIVTVGQLTLTDNGSFETTLNTAGGMWKYDGTYTIKVNYGSAEKSNSAKVELIGGVVANPVLTTPDTCGANKVSADGECIPYTITGGTVTGAMINTEDKSIVISINAEEDGMLTVTPAKSVQDGISLVFVDGEQWDDVEINSDTNKVTVMFLAGAEEVEIIGTFVIPEFGAIAAMILAVAIISIIAVSAKSRLSIMPRY